MNGRDSAVRIRAALDLVLDWTLGLDVSGPEALRAVRLAELETRAALRYTHRHAARDKLLADAKLDLLHEVKL